MSKLCFNEAFEKYGEYEDWYRSAYGCNGKSCPNFGKCKGNAEFDKLTKHPVIDYAVCEAINNERKFGVWDRETNNY